VLDCFEIAVRLKEMMKVAISKICYLEKSDKTWKNVSIKT
jgi:hypothetical protein